jgi:ATP-dependent Lhr-like helicase
MSDEGSQRRGLPPGPNVGTQLAARRRAAARRHQREVAQAQAPKPIEHTASEPTLPVSRDAREWFERRGWTAFAFQQEVWGAMAEGRSGVLHASTGAGKTLAVWLGAVQRLRARKHRGLKVLWITPMRALAADTQSSLQEAATALGTGWTVGLRTGDTEPAEKARQRRALPDALVTTPESLTLMLTQANLANLMSGLEVVILDEWHELLGSKRGTQALLALARLRALRPELIVWGLSATLGNLEEARDALTGPQGLIVQGHTGKRIQVDTLIPSSAEHFPWGGHTGLRLRDAVVEEVAGAGSCLIFTNTRSQAELWYQALLEARPDWAGLIALHHGSLDPAVRQWVEQGLKAGALKAVVCTSSLDLGVDFLPVERVLQIGSPKGVARLLQRAGRSGHAPDRSSRVTVIPTQALELLEGAAARRAVAAGRIEARRAPIWPLDVLIQHMVTRALGEGFTADELFDEVRRAWPYRELDRETFDWCLGFVSQGGDALAAYPDHHRLVADQQGVFRVARRDVARRHRMSIGTIMSDTAMTVKWVNGARLGSLEEGFVALLRPGDCFIFAGQVLELVRVRDLVAEVRKAPKDKGAVPTWQGGKMPLSNELADTVLEVLAEADACLSGRQPVPTDLPELQALQPILNLQRELSGLPTPSRLLIEQVQSDEGHHVFFYPLAGRMVHIGLGALIAWRAARERPGTFSLSMNDYGFELLSRKPFDWQKLIWPAGPDSWEEGILSSRNLVSDITAALNASELSQRRFREIARVAGLVFTGYPGAAKSARQVQASSGLFFEVFRKYDPGNLLLAQAEAETLAQELDIERLMRCLQRLRQAEARLVMLPRFTPFSFPLMIERLRERITTESVADRVQALVRQLQASLEPSSAAAELPAGRLRRRRRKTSGDA